MKAENRREEKKRDRESEQEKKQKKTIMCKETYTIFKNNMNS